MAIFILLNILFIKQRIKKRTKEKYDNNQYPNEIHRTVNVRKFTKLLCYKGNVKFDDIYDVFE